MSDQPSPNRIVRYSFKERAVHAIAGVLFVYVLLTGLAFWTPALYWIAVALGGGFLSRVLHPWVGVVLSVVVLVMIVLWRSDMRTTKEDRAWRRAMRKYVRNEDAAVPAAGRFNYGQKLFFWMTVWSLLLLLVSGIVMWIPENIPERIPENAALVREAAVLLHAISALVATGAFIVHVYMGVAVVPGSVSAILWGEVTREWARQHHRLWADDVVKRDS